MLFPVKAIKAERKALNYSTLTNSPAKLNLVKVAGR